MLCPEATLQSRDLRPQAPLDTLSVETSGDFRPDGMGSRIVSGCRFCKYWFLMGSPHPQSVKAVPDGGGWFIFKVLICCTANNPCTTHNSNVRLFGLRSLLGVERLLKPSEQTVEPYPCVFNSTLGYQPKSWAMQVPQIQRRIETNSERSKRALGLRFYRGVRCLKQSR